MNLIPNIEGVFYDIPEEEYHADALHVVPSASASLLKYMIDATPRHCFWASPRLNPKFVAKNTDRFDRGKIAHAWTLRSDAVVVEAAFDSWRTKAAQEFREMARAAGKIAVLSDDYRELREMVDAQREQLESLDCGNPFAGGKPEVVIRWREEFVHHGRVIAVWCRARLDNLNVESDNAYDLKSTEASANPRTWTTRTMWPIGAPYQAALYRRGLRRLSQIGILKMHDPDFVFVVVESTPPYCLSAITVPSDIKVPYSEMTADEKLNDALALWHDCLEKDSWPGYSSEVHDAEQFSFRRAAPRPDPSTGAASAHFDPSTGAVSAHLESQDVPDSAYTGITFKPRGANATT
jgi:hypothetical protein